MALLKALTKISVVLYLCVYYGQELINHGSIERKYFYFIGMSVVMFLISYTLYRTDKNIATRFLLFIVIGELFNNVFCAGENGTIEMILAIIGGVYVLFEEEFNNLLKFVKNKSLAIYILLEKRIKKWTK